MLTISVKNFGPMAEGAVDLKPLTIFVGPSNTGKSYMAAAIWAVSQAFQSDGIPYGLRLNRTYLRAFRQAQSGKYSGRRHTLDEDAEALQAIQEWLGGLVSPFDESHKFQVADLPEAAQSAIGYFARQWLDEISDAIISQLRRAYGDDSEFARNGRTEGFSLTVHRDEPLLSIDARLTGREKAMPEFDVSSTEVPPPEFRYQRMRWLEGANDSEIVAEGFLGAAKIAAKETLTAEFPSDSYYLPAARSGIAQGHKVLAAALIRQSSRIGLEPISIPTLPGMATEFLSQLQGLDKDMAERPQFTREMEEAVSFIESSVLHGKIELDESRGLPAPEIVYLPGADNNPTGKYNLDHTSSMVSELAPLILFLKYLVNPGDLLIIEEPESHLHPAAQLRMARGIARLVNAGVKVLVTTHSDIIISQINNLLALNQASPELVRDGDFAAEDFLDKDQVGAYLFQYGQESAGSEVTPLEIDSDTGIDDEEFAAVFEAIYDESIALQRERN